MAAPGDNLEFQETRYYAFKTAPAIELANAVATHIRAWPNGGKAICGNVRCLNLAWRGQRFEVVFSRKGQRIGLMNIFEVPGDQAKLDAYLKLVRETEASDRSRRKP